MHQGDLERVLFKIEDEWNAIQEILNEMGLRGFLHAIAGMSKKDDNLTKWLLTNTQPWRSIETAPLDGTYVDLWRVLAPNNQLDIPIVGTQTENGGNMMAMNLRAGERSLAPLIGCQHPNLL